LANNRVYYIKVITTDIIELYNDYKIQSKVLFSSSGSGTQSLTISSINIVDNSVYLQNHGYNTGDPIRLTGANLPNSLPSNSYFYVGSITVNSFTLHTQRSDALISINGLTVNDFDLTSTGSGTASITVQNVKIIDVIETSSKMANNWSNLSANNIDAANIVTGVINTSRLGAYSAYSDTFLRGDSTWSKAVQNIKRANSTTPITLTGSFDNVGSSTLFYNTVALDIDSVDGNGGDPLYSNLGVAQFKKSQFDIGTAGNLGKVFIKDDVINAASVNGNNSAYLLDSTNHTTQPVSKGGTNLTTYTLGDIIYANGTSSFGKLNIGTANSIMVSTGSAPSWSDSITINSLTVNGNLKIEGGLTSINSGKVTIADKNIQLGVVEAKTGLAGTIADSGTIAGPAIFSTITGLASTAGITGGMVLTRVSGTGSFGANAKVVDVISTTAITFQTTTLNTVGPIVFNIGGVTDDTANGGGITVTGPTDKTFTWSSNTQSWTSSENMDLAVNKEYKINTTTVLSSTQVLGKGFTSSAGEIVTSGSYWARTFAFMGV